MDIKRIKKEVLGGVLSDGWEQLLGRKYVNLALVFKGPQNLAKYGFPMRGKRTDVTLINGGLRRSGKLIQKW